ncbi:MAG: hypothetical protein WDW38_006482 [Sanguina aurantia]
MRVVLVDAGGTNIGSVRYALQRLGVDAELTSSDAAVIRAADKVILPGVGAAGPGMAATHAGSRIDVIVAVARRSRWLGVVPGGWPARWQVAIARRIAQAQRRDRSRARQSASASPRRATLCRAPDCARNQTTVAAHDAPGVTLIPAWPAGVTHQDAGDVTATFACLELPVTQRRLPPARRAPLRWAPGYWAIFYAADAARRFQARARWTDIIAGTASICAAARQRVFMVAQLGEYAVDRRHIGLRSRASRRATRIEVVTEGILTRLDGARSGALDNLAILSIVRAIGHARRLAARAAAGGAARCLLARALGGARRLACGGGAGALARSARCVAASAAWRAAPDSRRASFPPALAARAVQRAGARRWRASASALARCDRANAGRRWLGCEGDAALASCGPARDRAQPAACAAGNAAGKRRSAGAAWRCSQADGRRAAARGVAGWPSRLARWHALLATNVASSVARMGIRARWPSRGARRPIARGRRAAPPRRHADLRRMTRVASAASRALCRCDMHAGGWCVTHARNARGTRRHGVAARVDARWLASRAPPGARGARARRVAVLGARTIAPAAHCAAAARPAPRARRAAAARARPRCARHAAAPLPAGLRDRAGAPMRGAARARRDFRFACRRCTPGAGSRPPVPLPRARAAAASPRRGRATASRAPRALALLRAARWRCSMHASRLVDRAMRARRDAMRRAGRWPRPRLRRAAPERAALCIARWWSRACAIATRDSLILVAAPIDPSTLERAYAARFLSERTLRWNEQRAVVEAFDERRFGAIVLERRSVPVRPEDALPALLAVVRALRSMRRARCRDAIAPIEPRAALRGRCDIDDRWRTDRERAAAALAS